jgi:excisionase family DNA binding protein
MAPFAWPIALPWTSPKIASHTCTGSAERPCRLAQGLCGLLEAMAKSGRGASRPALGGRPSPLCSRTGIRAVKARRRHAGASASPALTALAVPEREFLEIGWCGHFCGHRCGRPQPTVGSMTNVYRTLQAPEEPLVYTVAEAGEMLGISRAFAYELAARGELPVIRLGRRRLVPKAGLLALVGQSEPAALSDPHES